MSIEFHCSQCGQLLAVDAGSAGKNARCPKCSTVQIIPSSPSSTQPLPGPSPPDMFCSKCGARNSENNFRCLECGEVLQRAAPARLPAAVPNYLVPAILATLFCCLPFGIVSIVYAAQVNGKVAGGDFEGARSDSEKAKMWAWISFGTGIAWIAIYVLLMIMAAAAGA